MRKCFLVFLFPIALSAVTGYVPVEEPGEEPWHTGPLISGSGYIASKGHWGSEPTFSAFHQSSYYDKDWNAQKQDSTWNLIFQVPFWIGLTESLDVSFRTGCIWEQENHATSWAFSDCSTQIGIQLHEDPLPHKNWIPAIKLFFRETIPTGKYKNLNPQKLGTDSGGWGAWNTTIGLNFQKLFYFQNDRFFNSLLNIHYSIPAPVHVKGFNSYGGGFGCNGTVYPEKILKTSLGFEYSLTRNWVLALDAVGYFGSKRRFSGSSGVNLLGQTASNIRPFSIQYSLSPAIEYNWSSSLGLITGCWFTVAGKNSGKFESFIIAFNYFK